MMEKVQRNAILDYVTYTEHRDDIRKKAMIEKDKRRVHLGDNLTFLFENTDTVRYQIQEMMRVERIVKEEAINHEIDTYNSLLGDKGELGCTLLIEFADPKARDEKLRELLSLPGHLYLTSQNGTKNYATFDETQVGEDKLSSVQFLKFKCDAPPVKIGCDHPALSIESDLSDEQQATLAADWGQAPA